MDSSILFIYNSTNILRQCWIFPVRKLFNILLSISTFSYQNTYKNQNYISTFFSSFSNWFYFHSVSFIFIHFRSFSFIFIHFPSVSFIFIHFGLSKHQRINKGNRRGWKPGCIFRVVDQRKGGQTTDVICQLCIICHHSCNQTV